VVYLTTPLSAARQGKGQPRLNGPAPRPAPAPKQPAFKQPQAKGKPMAPLPDPQLNRLAQMTPEQREKALSRMTPERRALLEQRLNQFQTQFGKLPPDQQAALQQRYDAFSKLPQERRTAIRDELQELRKLPAAQRADRLNSDLERQTFSSEELSILRGVTGVPEP
jgi:hypothetical protein